MNGASAYASLWAKLEKNDAGIHRLVYHLLDVGLTAQTLWGQGLHPTLKTRLAGWAGVPAADMGRMVGFLAALHDLGKASPAFQDHPTVAAARKAPLLAALAANGLRCPPRSAFVRHEVISTWALWAGSGVSHCERLIHAVPNLPPALADPLALVVGGHHGTWPIAAALDPRCLGEGDYGDAAWAAARRALVAALAEVFHPPPWGAYTPETLRDNRAFTLLSAIISAADWIGSDEHTFGYVSEILSPHDYVAVRGRRNAAAAVTQVGWEPPQAMPPFVFTHAFPFEPKPTQREVMAALAEVALPALAILEAPMGVGKTEAALAAYAGWARRSGAAGLYMAMPTTATSNQMHERAEDFLRRQVGAGAVPLLVHAQAALRPEQVPPPHTDVAYEAGETAAAQTWFLPRKKSLLAPYGVGTVDQALMAVLQTKHFFVRLLGLSHKVVIFDEVHAYDTYMSALFSRLLQWLRAVDASVIVLSATLPDAARRDLVAAWAGSAPDAPSLDCAYPRLTVVPADGPPQVTELPSPEPRALEYAWLEPGPEDASDEPPEVRAILGGLRAALGDGGGCAAVICNTVGRAQAVYRALQDEPDLCPSEQLTLFHARFPLAWREEIEKGVLQKFGPGKDKDRPNPDRPQRAVVVATQVIEQSLDLDFDVMISELAPVDLLLQRAGRLQRHAANSRPRPGHPDRLWIVAPAEQDGIPQLARGDAMVYAPYILLRTWQALHDRPSTITIPDDVAGVIEAVYGTDATPDGCTPAMLAKLAETQAAMRQDDLKERRKAMQRRIAAPSDEDLLLMGSTDLDEDNPALHEAFRALTRSDPPGVSVVCLHRVGRCIRLEPDPAAPPVAPIARPDRAMIRELARRVVAIRQRGLEAALLALPEDADARALLAAWRDIAPLRYHRVVVFEDSVCHLEGGKYTLRLNKDDGMGLQTH